MRRVAPSTVVREEIDELLAGSTSPETNILSALAQLGVRYVVQQGLEQEQADFVGRGRYERGAGGKGRRNGYEDAALRTAEGAIGVRVPQVRDAELPYRSKLIEFLAGNTEALDRLVVEMYARGLSTRDIEDAFRGPGGELLLSRTAVSEITDRLWEDYQAFCARDLSEIDVAYLFCDAIFESLRRYGAKEAVLACWCITTSGHQGPAAPGGGRQGVRALLDRVLPRHDLPRPTGPDRGHRRRRAWADQRHRGVLQALPADPLLVPPDGQHLGQGPRGGQGRARRPPARGP
jgi:putative transposase